MNNWLRKLRRSKHPKTQPSETNPLEQKRVAKPADFETDQPSTLIPNTPEKQEPIFVRGKYWKNTAETRWEFSPEQDIVYDGSIEDLIKMLGRIERVEYRRSAAEKLGLRGQAASPAIPALVLSAVDADKSVREAALCALNQIDPDWLKRTETLEVVPSLVLALKSKSQNVPEAASRLLKLIGPSAVPDLVEALATKEDTVDKILIIRILARYGPDAAGAVPELSRALGSEHLQERIAAANALLKIGPEAVAALPELIVGLSDPFSDCRLAMVTCLANLKSAAEPAVPALVLLLADRETKVCQASATALEEIGPKSIPILVEFLQMRNVKRSDAGQTLKNDLLTWAKKPARDFMVIDIGQAWANLSWWITDMIEDLYRLEYAQQAALAVLAKFGPVAGAATPTIAQALADPNPNIKLAAILALGQIGPEASSAIPILIQLMADSDTTLLAAVQESLENIDRDWRSDPAIQGLIATLATRFGNADKSRQLQAIHILTWIGVPAVPTLIDSLQHGNLPARENAAITLGRIGEDAKEAVPALTDALQDNNSRVQTEAANALKRINNKVT